MLAAEAFTADLGRHQPGTRPPMADEMNPDQDPRATVLRKELWRISIVRIVPMLAALVRIRLSLERSLTSTPNPALSPRPCMDIAPTRVYSHCQHKGLCIWLLPPVKSRSI
jgi:hypothetical protein